MAPVLHPHLPEDMHRIRPLPGVTPVTGTWLRCDEAYAGQMALRRDLLAKRPSDVLQTLPGSEAAAEELWRTVCADLPTLGFTRAGDGWRCPDGVWVADGPPLETLGRLCQADFCLMEQAPGQAEHVLTAALLCFPASWSLHEKIGWPLTGIHEPVEEYDDTLARRVQRLFDGVQPARPIWRFNRLWYHDPALYQPRTEAARRDKKRPDPPYLRCERQVILRLPQTRAVVFAIHTYVIARQNLPNLPL